MTFLSWLRRFFGPTDKLTTEELGRDDDHLPRASRDERACTNECVPGWVRQGCPVHDPKEEP